LRAPAQTRGADGRAGGQFLERRPVGRDERVARLPSLGNRSGHEFLGLFGRHILHRVDRAVEILLEDALVEFADERAGLPEPVDQLVSDLVARRLHGDEFDLVPAVFQGLFHQRGLSPGECGPPRRQSQRPVRSHRSQSVPRVEKRTLVRRERRVDRRH